MPQFFLTDERILQEIICVKLTTNLILLYIFLFLLVLYSTLITVSLATAFLTFTQNQDVIQLYWYLI